jgi:hypothetical protein
MPLKDKDPDLLYYSYYKQGLAATRAPYSFKSLLAITKHIYRYYLLIIIKKAIAKTQEVINQQLRQLYRQAKTNGDIKEFNLKVLKASLNKLVLLKALITLIII